MKNNTTTKRIYITVFLLKFLLSNDALAEKIPPRSTEILSNCNTMKTDVCSWPAKYQRMIVNINHTGKDENYILSVLFKHTIIDKRTAVMKYQAGAWGKIKLYNLQSEKLYKTILVPNGKKGTGSLMYSAYPGEDLAGSGYSYVLHFNEPGQYLIEAEIDPKIPGIDNMVYFFLREGWHK